MNNKDKQIMRSFMQNFKITGVTLILSLFVQGCYTYVPSMSNETDGVYYSPKKDAERTNYMKGQYSAYQNTDDNNNTSNEQGDYYAPSTPLEEAYWSTMPSSYAGGDVKIVNNYYNGSYATSVVPKINISLGYGWNNYYSSGWSFGLGFSWGTPYYGYYNPWNTGWIGYYYDPWYWYDPWYRPWYSPWGMAHYGGFYDPWMNPYYNPWRDPWYGHHGHHGGHRPVVAPPRRYSNTTQPNDHRRPLGSDTNDKKYDGTRNPSSGNNNGDNNYRPSTGGGVLSIGEQGYYRRVPVKGDVLPNGNKENSDLNNKNNNGSGTVPPANYRPSNQGGSTTTPNQNGTTATGTRSEYQNIRGNRGGGTSSTPYYRPNNSGTTTTREQRSNNGGSQRNSYTPTGTTRSTRTYSAPSSSSSSTRSYQRSTPSYRSSEPSSSYRSSAPSSSSYRSSAPSSSSYRSSSSSSSSSGGSTPRR